MSDQGESPMASFPIDMSIFTAELYHRELVRRYQEAKEQLKYAQEGLSRAKNHAENAKWAEDNYFVAMIPNIRIEIEGFERIVEELKARFPDIPGKELL